MPELLSRAAASDASALLALEHFAYSVKKQIGAYFAALGGLDCLVFTGGIGEHVALVRELSCGGLEGLGIELDASLNAAHAPLISSTRSACEVRVVSTNEDLIIARSAYALYRGSAQQSRAD
jgi:acetate kinase